MPPEPGAGREALRWEGGVRGREQRWSPVDNPRLPFAGLNARLPDFAYFLCPPRTLSPLLAILASPSTPAKQPQ